MRIGIMPGQWGWSYPELCDAWRAADQCGFDLVGCFDHVSAGPRGVPAWDAPSLLTAMAGRTTHARLAIWVVNVSLRHPLLLAGQIAVAQAESAGRIEVGLGAGSYSLARFDHGALALPFPPLHERVMRVEACARVLPALWGGAVVNEPALGLVEASLGPLGIQVPPLLVGGRSESMIQVAARHADGWNLEEASPETFAEMAGTVMRIASEAGRDRRLEVSVQVFADDLQVTQMRALVDRYRTAGADTVMFLLDRERDPAWVERVAKAVL